MLVLGVFRLLRERSAFIEPADIKCNVLTGSFSRRLCKIKNPRLSPSVAHTTIKTSFIETQQWLQMALKRRTASSDQRT